MKKVMYSGSFDPITYGHQNVIEQASVLFDEVVIAVLQNSSKSSGLFTIEESVDMIMELYKDNENIKVVTGSGAAVDVAIEHGCCAIIRGLRGISDYDYEVQLAHVNRKLSDNKVNTVCLMADSNYQFISSSVVREIFALDKDVSEYVDPIVKNKMLEKKKVR